jgi:HSP20 family protein
MSTLVKTQFGKPSQFNGLFGKDFFNELNIPAYTSAQPAVNVVEGENGFRIELAAPGFNKSDFQLNLEKNQLTISAQKEEKATETNEKYTRKEFNYASFKRVFTLPNSVDGEQISALYTDGILNVTLPKKEEAKEKPARLIEVA